MATIYYTASTLDGFLATTDHSLEWLFVVKHGPEIDQIYRAFIDRVGVLAMGSSTYEWIREHDAVDSWEEWYGDRPTWVFTHRDLPGVAGADLRFTQEDVGSVHAEMVDAAAGRDIWLMGGGELVGQFADAGLLDRIVVGVTPVTLGEGAPLLPRAIGSDRLTLRGVVQSDQIVMLTYDVGPVSPA